MKTAQTTPGTPLARQAAEQPVGGDLDAKGVEGDDSAAPAEALETDDEVLGSVPKAFEINSEETANWLVKKIIAARQYSERVKLWAEREQRRAAREEQTLMFLFGRQIETWARAEINQRFKGRRQSLLLPAGQIGFRHVGPNLVVDDEKLVLNWAKVTCPHAVVITEKLSKSVVNEYVKNTGDVPPAGVRVDPGTNRFFIR